MRSEGRIEKRVAVKIPVHLVPEGNTFVAEPTTIINISRRGACVLAGRHWEPGEQLCLASSLRNFRREARVVYCHPRSNGQFCMGLEFDASIGDRNNALWSSSTLIS